MCQYEGVELEDYVFCGPSIVFTNIKIPSQEFPQKGTEYYSKTIVRRSASIGANATIVCGVTIGEYALIGAGSVVTKDVHHFHWSLAIQEKLLEKLIKMVIGNKILTLI